MADVFLDVAGFFFAGLAARARLDLRHFFFGFVIHHAGGQQLHLIFEIQDAVAAHGLHQRAMGFATGLCPSKRFLLAQATGHKPRRLQTGLHRLQRLIPSGGDPVHQQIFKHDFLCS